MSVTTGVKARKRTGMTRAQLKRANRRKKAKKVFTNNAMPPEAYRKLKLDQKKALKRGRP